MYKTKQKPTKDYIIQRKQNKKMLNRGTMKLNKNKSMEWKMYLKINN